MQNAAIGLPCIGFAPIRESGMVESACVHCRAFSQEPPPETRSRDGRVTALWVNGVSAPDKLRRSPANCGWYRGRNAFRPDVLG